MLKKGTLEHCVDTLEVNPVNVEEDASKGHVGNEHVTIEAGKTFIVSTKSVKITTW